MRPPLPHRLNNFDVLRLTAAWLVLFSHQHALTGRPEPGILGVHSLGGLGVLVFFSISGFLVAQSWHADPNVWRFSARRLLRIFPALAVVLVLTALVLGPLTSRLSWHEYYVQLLTADYFKNARFQFPHPLRIRFDGNALPSVVNGALWTIPLELKCYAALAVLGLAGLLRRRWLLLVLLLAATAGYALISPRGDLLLDFLGWHNTQRFLLEFGLFFFAGTTFYAFRLHHCSLSKKAMLTGICWALAGAAFWAGRPLLALWLVMPVTVLLFASASTPFLRRAGRFGDLSYGMYIYAFPVQQTLVWLNQGSLSWRVLLCLTVAVTSLLAFASWHLVEKRALRLKPGSTQGKALAADVFPVTYAPFKPGKPACASPQPLDQT